MSDATNNASGVDSVASGETGVVKDSVSYDSYSKLLNQHKAGKLEKEATKAENAELRERLKSIEDGALIEQNKFKELYENSLKEKEDLTQKFGALSNSIVRAEKINAFEKAAGATLKHEAYYSHIDVEAIQMNDAGDIDEDSLATVVGAFKNVHGETLFNINTAKTLPSGTPKGVPSKGLKDLTSDEIKAKLRELQQ